MLPDAGFCVECGERQAAAAAAPPPAFPWQRWAPVFVLLVVLAVGGSAVLVGWLSPRTPPAAPRRGAPTQGDAGVASLPPDHPPVEIPEDTRKAIADLAAKAVAAPEDVDAWKHLAGVQYRAGQIVPTYLRDAEKSYQHVLARAPDDLETLRALGNIAFDLQQTDTAIDFYQRYLQRKPDDLGVQTDMGTMYLAAGQPAKAVEVYESVLQTDAAFFQAQFNLSIAYRSLGQREAALAALEKARTVAPDTDTRARVDQILAQVKAQPQPPAGTAAPAPQAESASAPTAAAPTFQSDVEALFRESPIMGPKLQRVQWRSPEHAQMYLRDFPVEEMGEDMRAMFLERMREKIRARKDAHGIAGSASVDLVDAASGRVMDTITE